MDSEHLIFDSLLSIYRHHAVIIEHPRINQPYIDKKAAMKNRIPFYCVEQGSCNVSCNGEDYVLEKGDFIAMTQGSHHILSVNENQAIQGAILICGYFEFLTQHHKILTSGFPEVLMSKGSDKNKSKKIKALTQLMMQEINSGNPGSKQAAAMLADLFFIELLRSIVKQCHATKGIIAALANRQLAKSIEAFHANFARRWTLGQLAKEAGMSRTKFAITFRTTVGVSPGTYMTHWRMNWAAVQLKETEKSLSEIGLSSGYLSNTSFSRTFKKVLGIPPDEYRKNHTNLKN